MSFGFFYYLFYCYFIFIYFIFYSSNRLLIRLIRISNNDKKDNNTVILDGHVFVENASQLVNINGIVLFVDLLQSLLKMMLKKMVYLNCFKKGI